MLTTQAFTQTMILGTLKVSGKYPGIQENECASLDDYSIYVNVNPQASVARQATFRVNSAYEGK